LNSWRPLLEERVRALLPDLRSLRIWLVGGAGGLALLFGACLVFAAVQLDERRGEEVARARAHTLAATAGMWLDGDAHAGLGQAPGKRLQDLGATLKHLLEVSGYPGTVRTLRPRPEVKTAMATSPRTPRAGALEVVLDSAGQGGAEDYRPVMAEALFEDGIASELLDGEILAYAPVFDSWGATTALVCVRGPARAPLWRRLLFQLGSGLLAALMVAASVLLARRYHERLALYLSTLESGVRQAAGGQIPGPFVLARSAPTELATLAGSLEELRVRLAPEVAQAALEEPVAEAADPVSDAAPVAEEFDLALLLQQLGESARKAAQVRGVAFQLVFPDGVPSHVVGDPQGLYRALEALLRHALRTTARGQITLRVSRVAEGAGDRLRFEVADSSPGIPFREQEALAAALAESARGGPEGQGDPLRLASALAARLGGELGFESQPGQGSRFAFCAELGSWGGARQAEPSGIGVPPESAFVQRPPLATR